MEEPSQVINPSHSQLCPLSPSATSTFQTPPGHLIVSEFKESEEFSLTAAVLYKLKLLFFTAFFRRTGVPLPPISRSWMKTWNTRRGNRNLTSRTRTRASQSRQVQPKPFPGNSQPAWDPWDPWPLGGAQKPWKKKSWNVKKTMGMGIVPSSPR